jgi:phytoene dehydrogenase-like protein
MVEKDAYGCDVRFTKKDDQYDAIIIGGGPNGLTTGAYLSKAGQKVLVMERRYEMGGGCNIEEVTAPGYYHNTHAIYMMMADYAPAYKDLKLEEDYGLKHIYPAVQMVMPFKDGNTIALYNEVERTCQSFAKFSQKDADKYKELYDKFQVWMDDFLGPYTYTQPKATIELAMQMQQLEMGQEMMELTEMSPLEMVNEWFESERVRTLMLNALCFWGFDPEQSGLGYLLSLYFNRTTSYRICEGGSHMLTQALIKVILENGGKCQTAMEASKLIVEDGVVKGVIDHYGQKHMADIVVSTLDTHNTFLKLIEEQELDSEFIESVKMWQWDHWSLLGVHLALEDAPQFMYAKDDPELNQALIYILGCETTEDYVQHQKDIENGIFHPGSIVHCTFPTALDPGQVKDPGPTMHTCLIQQQTPYELADGGTEKWRARPYRYEIIDALTAKMQEYFPNLTAEKIRGKYLSTPLDVENKYHDMVRGSIKQGQYHPLQMGYMRPNEECSWHRSPIKGLYMGGACTYPGGTVLLAPGYLAAEAIMEDTGGNKWWPEPDIITKAREKGIPGFD